MNFIAIIILCTIGVDFILNLVADGLNLKHLRSELPQTFQGVYDADRYRKSQQYLKVNTQFGWITSAFNLSVILVFWFAKGFPLLDQWVRSFERGPVLTGLIYMGILMLFKALLSLPFSLYATFVIEERFGFNTTTWKTLLMDLIKGLVLTAFTGNTAAGRHSGIFSICRCQCLVVLLDWRHTLICWVFSLLRPPGSCRLFNKYHTPWRTASSSLRFCPMRVIR